MGKSKKRAVVESESEPEEEVYHVEVITKARVAPLSDDEEGEIELDDYGKQRVRTAKWEYYVKWAGYDSDACSWEPEQNVAGCQRLLSSFWNHIGLDNKDYAIGHIFEASEKWIKKEKRYFEREFNQAKAESLKEKEKEKEKKKKSKKRSKKSPTLEASKKASSSSKGKERRTDTPEQKSLTIRLSKRKRVDSLSSDDQPLAQMVSPAKVQKIEEVDVDLTAQLSSPAAKPRSSSPTNSLFSEKTSPRMDAVAELPAPIPSASTGPPKPKRPIPLPPVPKRKASSSRPLNPFLGPTTAVPMAQPNPTLQAAPMAPPPPSVPGPSQVPVMTGISTKQRLAQNALAPTNPKLLLQASKIKPSARSATLAQLNFKKKRPEEPVLSKTDDVISEPSPNQNEPTLAALNASAASPTREDHASTSLSDHTTFDSPISTTVHDSLSQFFDRANDSNNLFHSPVSSRAIQLEQAAERFLQEAVPNMATPILPMPEVTFEPQPPKALHHKEKAIPLPPPKPSRVFKWSGNITFETGGEVKTLCKVVMADNTQHSEMGLPLAVIMSTLRELHIPSFHDAADLDILLRACKIDQLARVSPLEEQDIGPLRTFVRYMMREDKVALIPIDADGIIVAHMLLFPSASEVLQAKFKVPLDLRKQGYFIVVVLPWRLSHNQIELDGRPSPNTYVPASPRYTRYISSDRWPHSIRSSPLFQNALRILKFPKALYDFMSEARDRSYAIFTDQSPRAKKEYAYETALLRAILDQCGQKASRSGESEWRVAFVHIGALGQLSKFQKFVEKRATRPELQFYTYGTHDSVPSDEWGVKEIYPCGGVVTFTAHALSQNPIGVYRLIKQLNEHPLWLGYITPETLGMAITLLSGSENPYAFSERPNFPLQVIVSAINDGVVALLTAPPLTMVHDARAEWLKNHLCSRPLTARSIVELAVTTLNSRYINTPKDRVETKACLDLVDDLLLMQRQPCLMRDYRRYVLIRGNEAGFNNDIVESATLTSFDFHDDFFVEKI
ncbi:hypothetical protein AX16_005596 [Volvariella volvacea WC 439]|nr:hypothetical protein AX16_005596 [Volvariella volvacea WC 439]